MSNKSIEPILKINGSAFDKFLYMRDYKPYEVAMFGITYADNPLHVYDFELVKQKVNSLSADCDPQYMADFLVNNISKGIMPINCERIWCHTHPMTGENSANPSGKDMATWNDTDNSHKNFLVMLILSKSGQITCKLRIRSNWNKEVTGLNIPFEFEKDIKVEIIKDESYINKIKQAIVNNYGQQAVDKLGDDAIKVFAPYLKLIDIYPEFINLHNQYEELVSLDTYTSNNNNNNNRQIGYNNHTYIGSGPNYVSNNKKKEASENMVPEMLLMISEHKDSFNPISESDLNKIKESFEGIDGVEDLAMYEKEFKRKNPTKPDDFISVVLGAISGDILDTDNSSVIIKHKTNELDKRAKACNSAGMIYTSFKNIAIQINTGVKV